MASQLLPAVSFTPVRQSVCLLLRETAERDLALHCAVDQVSVIEIFVFYGLDNISTWNMTNLTSPFGWSLGTGPKSLFPPDSWWALSRSGDRRSQCSIHPC